MRRDLGVAVRVFAVCLLLAFEAAAQTQPNVTLSENGEPAEGGATSSVVANLSAPSDQNVTVNLAFSGTATFGNDYTPSATSIVIQAGSTSGSITLTAVQDATYEGEEQIAVDIASVVNGTEATPQRVSPRIIDDDALPTLSIGDVTQAEGNSGTTDFAFAVTLTGATERDVSVDFSTFFFGSSDYVPANGILSFTPGGPTTVNAIVRVVGDTTNEPDESFTVALFLPQNATIVDEIGVGTILNDDPLPTLAIDNVTRAEGNAGTTNFVFTVRLTGSSTDQVVTVNYATADGTATAGTDYTTTTTGTLTFTPPERSKTITVPVSGDQVFELDETFTVTLSDPGHATITTPTGTGTIVNDDPAPTIAIDNVTRAEGNAGTTNFVFTVSLTGSTSQTVTVDYATTDGTATAGTDYTTTTGTLTFTPTDTSETITVPVSGDQLFELDETFTVTLSDPGNATIATSTGTGTIVNDEAMPTLAIDNVTRAEGNAGTTNFVFTVTLTGSTDQIVTVDYATTDGTATAGTDYTTTTGTLTFTPTDTAETITVPVSGDQFFEPDETFTVTLSNPGNATIATPTGTGTIVNDDASPTLAIDNVTRAEGNAGATNFVFTVSLTGSTSQTVTVDYATADGTATSGTDYIAVNGTLTFTPGDTEESIIVPVIGDPTFEPNETFSVNLTGAVGASITTGTGTGTIQNDDSSVANLSITKTVTSGHGTVGEPVSYLITVGNAGPSAATSVTVTDVLPASATLLSGTASQGTCSGTTTVTCTLGGLANGASATITLVVTPREEGPLSNTATVAGAPQSDNAPANNASTVVVTVAAAAPSDIPTVSEWALMFLALSFAFLGVIAVKRS